MSKITIITGLLLGALGVSQASANNGQIAYAHPLIDRQINIDGDLSDWPEDIQTFPIERDFHDQDMPDKSDFSAYFRAVYSETEKAIYIGLQVTDQSHVVDEGNPQGWNVQDSVTIYIDANHSRKGSGSHLYTAMGNQRALIGSPNGWDPMAVEASWDNVDVNVKRRGNETTYEWRVDMKSSSIAGRSIGFDLLISDTDKVGSEEQQSLYIWGPFTGKSQSANRIGDLVLLKQGSRLGTLKGQVKSELTVKEDTPIALVKVVDTKNPDFWLQAPVDVQGNYQVKLPEGQYKLSSAQESVGDPWRGLSMVDLNAGVETSVQANSVTTAPVLKVKEQQAPDLIQTKGVLFDYDDSKKQEVDRVIKAYMQHYKVPGVSIALVNDGKLVYHNAIGTKNAFTGEPVTGNTLFEAASITKIVFAFAVNRLAERGVIDLDKPLYQYLPFEQIAHDERYKKITARYVLSHRTGFPNWSWQNPDGKLDIKFYPGIKFGYSGEGFEYLGRVVSHITGKPLEQVIMEEVQKPMGLTDNTYFSDNAQLQKQVSHGHYATFPTPMNIPSEIGVAYSMHTEAKVFSNFMINLMQKKGLSEQGYTKMLEPQVDVPIKPDEGDFPWPQGYSLGFYFSDTPYGFAYGHSGSNGDFNCLLEIFQEQKAGFVIFTNNDTGTAFYKKLYQYLITGEEY